MRAKMTEKERQSANEKKKHEDETEYRKNITKNDIIRLAGISCEQFYNHFLPTDLIYVF